MESDSKQQQRKNRIANIKLTLKQLPALKSTAKHLEIKLVKNRQRKSSMQLLDKDVIISKELEESDIDSQSKFRSLFMEKYQIGEKIGQGAHGVVRKCYCKEDNQLLAVKTLQMDRQHIHFLRQNFLDIRQLQHKHIIGYKALFFQKQAETCHLVMDYLPHPNLEHIQISSEYLFKDLVFQILQALNYIHDRKICHRDIKPQNILYDTQNKNIIIIDFGISKKLMHRGRKRDMLTLTGTPYYRAPEMFQGGGYDEMVDMWALGITMYKLMTGFTPFESEYHSETIENIVRGQFSFPPATQAKYSKSARNLVMRLLKKRGERLTAKEAMKDMWFIQLIKGVDDMTHSVKLEDNHIHIFGHSFLFNNSLVSNNYQKSQKKEELIDINQLKYMSQQVIAQNDNIYGDQVQKMPASSKDIVSKFF